MTLPLTDLPGVSGENAQRSATRLASKVSPPGKPKKRQAIHAKTIWRGAAGVVVLVLTMEIVSRLGIVSATFLPPFSTVVAATGGLFVNQEFLIDLVSTLLTWAIGLALSIIVAVPLGIILGLSDITYRASRTVIELIRPMPAVALIPLVLLTVGQGMEMKLIVAIYAAMWPILFNTIYGVHGVDPKSREMGRSFGLSHWQVVRRIVVPSATPFIATGVRLSSAIVLIVIITVELVAGGAEGLGAFIARTSAVGSQVPLVYAGILVTGLLGLVINLAMGNIERRWLGWNATKGK